MAPSNISIRLVEKSNRNDALIEAAVQVQLSTVDKTDPLVMTETDGNMDLLPLISRSIIRPFALMGDMYTATDENDDLVGFLTFTRPGEELFSTDEQRKLGFETYLAALSDEGKAWIIKALGGAAKFVDESLGTKFSSLNYYWCDCAFVRPDYQGKGVATAMFELAFAQARGMGSVGVGLQTMAVDNIPILQAIGLKLKGRTINPSPNGDWPLCVFSEDFQG